MTNIDGKNAVIPAALGDNKSAVFNKAVPSGYNDQGNGLFKNHKTGQSLRVSSQGIFGDTLMTKNLGQMDNAVGSFATWLNNDLGHVGRYTFVERFNKHNQATSASFYRIDDKNALVKEAGYTVKPEAGQKKLSDAQLNDFRQKTTEGIENAQWRSNVFNPLGCAAAVALIATIAYFGGQALAPLASAVKPLLGNIVGQIIPKLGSIKTLLTQSPKAFQLIGNAIKTLATKFKIPTFTMPTLSQSLKWLSVQTLQTVALEKLILNPGKMLWRKLFG